MSSNRLIYDKGTYQKAVQESTDPSQYMLYTGKYVNNNQCMIRRGVVGGNNVSVWAGNMVDLESDLYNITRPASLCPSMKYQPKCRIANPQNTGLPSGTYDCQGNLVNKRMCDMNKYHPRINAPTFPGSTCQYK